MTSEQLKKYIETIIFKFYPYSFSADFGFPNFLTEDLLTFFLTPSQFELKLNREKGRHILYGHQHVRIRQAAINDLPITLRLEYLLPKFEHYHLYPKISVFLTKWHPHIISNNWKITDIRDIGMGHSVYCLEIRVENHVFHLVIKRESVIHQEFYTHLLRILGIPSYQSCHFADETGKWELMEYIAPDTLLDVLVRERVGGAQKSERFECASRIAPKAPAPPDIHPPTTLNWLEAQLPTYSALGDVLGLGDRHLENYIVKDKQLFPIDISFLFWESNESWIRKYVAGGTYEINAILPGSIPLFFDKYQEKIAFLKSRRDDIMTCIQIFFGENPQDLARIFQFIEYRFSSDYFHKQKALYLSALEEYSRRLPYKLKLDQMVQAQPEILESHPLLKMYYYANQDRLSAFYLLEDQEEDVLDIIDQLNRDSAVKSL